MKKLAALGFMVVLLAACNGSQRPSASVSPNPSSAASSGRVTSGARTETPSPPSATPSPEPPAVGLHAQCRLPVYWWDSDTSPDRHSGFVHFPAGQLVEDNSAPAGAISGGLFYDRALGKWIHAIRDWVSPDGREYAYAQGYPLLNQSGKLHVVDVTTGADRVIYNSSFVPTPVQFSAEGIYFTNDGGEGFEMGLWLISPQGGQPRLISTTIFRPLVANGAAWGLAFNAADPHPAPGGITKAHNTILRLNLQTGASIAWWYQPGYDLQLLDGDYSGNLFVLEFNEAVDNSMADWVIESRGTARRIGSANLSFVAAVDSNGVWFDESFGSQSSLWLYANGELERIAGFDVAGMTVAGGCIPGA